MAVIVQNRNGGEVMLLNPSEKGLKYSLEIKHKKALTNTGKRKIGDDGRQLKLSDTQLAWRAGYLQAQKDSANAFKHKHPRYKSKNKR